MTLNSTNVVGNSLRDSLSTQLAFSLPPRAVAAADDDAAAAVATAAGLGVEDARGRPLATPSVLPPLSAVPPPADDDDDDEDVSLSVVGSVDDDAR